MIPAWDAAFLDRNKALLSFKPFPSFFLYGAEDMEPESASGPARSRLPIRWELSRTSGRAGAFRRCCRELALGTFDNIEVVLLQTTVMQQKPEILMLHLAAGRTF